MIFSLFLQILAGQIDKYIFQVSLLYLLAANAGRLLTRNEILDYLWGADYVGDTKTLDVHVKRLRAKIEVEPSEPTQLITVRGLGYKLDL